MPSGAVTMIEQAKTLSVPAERAVIQTYAETYPVMSDLPLRNIASGVDKWTLETDLPYAVGSGKRDLGANFSSTHGQVSNFSGEAKVYGGRIQIDNYLMTQNPDGVAFQRHGQIAAYAKEFVTDMFQGTGGTGLRGIDWWIDNQEEFISQDVVGSNAGTASVGATLSLDLLDRLFDKVSIEKGNPFLVVSQRQKRKIMSLNRGNGSSDYNVTYSKDGLGEPIEHYNTARIVTVVDGKGNDVLSTTKGDGTSSSVYLVTMGQNMYDGFMMGAPNVRLANKDETSFNYDVFEWYINAAPKAIRSVGRLEYISEA